MVPYNARTWNGSCIPVHVAGVSSPSLRHRFHSILHTSTSYSSSRLIVRAEKRPSSRKTRQVSGKRDSGFFADVDPNATIYPVKGSLKQDPTKRGGRWESDFVWNSNWKEAMEYDDAIRESNNARQKKTEEKEESSKGKLSLVQAKKDLNDVNVDLSDQLRQRKRDGDEKNNSNVIIQVEKKPRRSSGDAKMTQREGRAWRRSDRYAIRGGSGTRAGEEEEKEKTREIERERYDQLKRELQLWSVGLTAVCFGCTVAFYGRDVGASYGIGALGGLLYLRSLSRSVDSFGVGGVGGGPRLLIPVILALGYNRYNTLVAEQSGLYLQLLPMLAGFFTYKGAVIARQSKALFDEYTGKTQQWDDDMDDDMSDQDREQKQESVASVDRAFSRTMLTKY
ncbi:hypothetical protein M9434_002662 [Picochlorum sp. BPE23]|nr:hypothetical protein M9434_002662 [Picochlorum sp. BPE23]